MSTAEVCRCWMGLDLHLDLEWTYKSSCTRRLGKHRSCRSCKYILDLLFRGSAVSAEWNDGGVGWSVGSRSGGVVMTYPF